jgi:hypothetical protein
MMFEEQDYSRLAIFPFAWPSYIQRFGGPTGSDLAAMYFAANFYDIAHEAGLGAHKSDLLIWKSISLITNSTYCPVRLFGEYVQRAARELWADPRPGRAGKSLYEEDIADVLTSRGIPLYGVADFRTNLPPAIGDTNTLDDLSEALGFYAEDVRPFGFRVIQATPNGFSFIVTALTETPTNKTYQLTIVDRPSRSSAPPPTTGRSPITLASPRPPLAPSPNTLRRRTNPSPSTSPAPAPARPTD